jgi:hypothetical protein
MQTAPQRNPPESTLEKMSATFIFRAIFVGEAS